jgi:hypothetical protein
MVNEWTSRKKEQCTGAFPGMAGESAGKGHCSMLVYNEVTKKYS